MKQVQFLWLFRKVVSTLLSSGPWIFAGALELVVSLSRHLTELCHQMNLLRFISCYVSFIHTYTISAISLKEGLFTEGGVFSQSLLPSRSAHSRWLVSLLPRNKCTHQGHSSRWNPPRISQIDRGPASRCSRFWGRHSLSPCLKYHFPLFCLGSLVALDGVFTFRDPFFAQRPMTSSDNNSILFLQNCLVPRRMPGIW